VDSIQDSEHDSGTSKKKKKKKKKKKQREDSDSESWEEKTKENLSKFEKSSRSEEEISCKKSTSDPNAPIKNWDSKPAAGTTERSVTWDGRKSTNIADQLSRASEIRSWGGDRSTLEKKNPDHQRKRSLAQEMDADIDAGRVKKFKKQNHDEPARWANSNPFQMAQEHRNKGEDFTQRREFRRHSDSFSRHDKSRHSDPYHGGRYSDQFSRNNSARFSDHRPSPSGHHRDQHFSHKYRADHHNKYSGSKKFRR